MGQLHTPLLSDSFTDRLSQAWLVFPSGLVCVNYLEAPHFMAKLKGWSQLYLLLETICDMETERVWES